MKIEKSYFFDSCVNGYKLRYRLSDRIRVDNNIFLSCCVGDTSSTVRGEESCKRAKKREVERKKGKFVFFVFVVFVYYK